MEILRLHQLVLAPYTFSVSEPIAPQSGGRSAGPAVSETSAGSLSTALIDLSFLCPGVVRPEPDAAAA